MHSSRFTRAERYKQYNDLSEHYPSPLTDQQSQESLDTIAQQHRRQQYPSAITSKSKSIPSLSESGSVQNTMENIPDNMDPVSKRSLRSRVQSSPGSMETWRQQLHDTDVVVLYVWKESCVPCVHTAPQFDTMAEYCHRHVQSQNLNVSLLFVKDQIDAVQIEDETSPTYAHWRICEAVPFFMIYVKNQVFYQTTGFEKEKLFRKILEAVDVCASSASATSRLTSHSERHEDTPNVVYYTHHG